MTCVDLHAPVEEDLHAEVVALQIRGGDNDLRHSRPSRGPSRHATQRLALVWAHR